MGFNFNKDIYNREINEIINNVTSQVADMNKILQKFQDNDNYMFFNKLNAGNVSAEFDDAHKIETAINALRLETTPRVGYIYMTGGGELPAEIWKGTTWKKIEGRMLLGTSSKHSSGDTGGSETKTISVSNMPRHRHRTDNHTHDMQHTHNYRPLTLGGRSNTMGNSRDWYAYDHDRTTGGASRSSTGGSSPNTDYQGSGTAMDVMNPYRVVNIWERIS